MSWWDEKHCMFFIFEVNRWNY